jgi:hypothetical protein
MTKAKMTKHRTGSAKTTDYTWLIQDQDVITQSDLRVVRGLTIALERLEGNIASRIDLGAKVQTGAIIIEDVIRGITFPKRITGKLTKRIKSAA